MSPADKSISKSLSRARWSVLQTGLITAALSLFGVYVLCNRSIDEMLPMDWYVLRWFALGPLLVGTFAGVGYLIGAHWNGLPIRGWFFAVILLLQLLAYLGAQYAQSIHFFYRDGGPVGLIDYLKYRAVGLGAVDGRPQPVWECAILATVEVIAFMLIAFFTPLVLRKTARCANCGGALRNRPFGAVVSANELPHVAQLASIGPPEDARQLELYLRPGQFPDPAQLQITLTRCAVCGSGALIASNQAPIKLPIKLTEKLWTRPLPPKLTSRPSVPPATLSEREADSPPPQTQATASPQSPLR